MSTAYLVVCPSPELRSFYPHAVWHVYPGVNAVLYRDWWGYDPPLTTVSDGWEERVEDTLETAELKFLAGVKE